MPKDKLSLEIVKKLIKKEGIKPLIYDSVDSTNKLLKALARSGCDEGTLVIAEHQTEGRGRLERSFFSPDSSGIYMSLLLKPSLKAENAVLITAAAAVAVSAAIEALTGKATEIKWVNDVYLGNKKVCGILTEGSVNTNNEGLNWAVLGIGINVYPPEGGFPEEISQIAGAVFDKKNSGLRNRIIAEVINNFYSYYADLEDKAFFEDYRKRLMLLNQKVMVLKGDEKREAIIRGIDDSFRLLVEYDDKSREYLCSGEISVKGLHR